MFFPQGSYFWVLASLAESSLATSKSSLVTSWVIFVTQSQSLTQSLSRALPWEIPDAWKSMKSMMKYDMRGFKAWGSQNHWFPDEKSPILTNLTRRPRGRPPTTPEPRAQSQTALTFHRCPSLHKDPHGLERHGVRIPSVQRNIGSRSPRSLDPGPGPTPHRPVETWKPSSPDIPHRCPGHSHHLVPSFCENSFWWKAE